MPQETTPLSEAKGEEKEGTKYEHEWRERLWEVDDLWASPGAPLYFPQGSAEK